MNFSDALKLVFEGKTLRLPEWKEDFLGISVLKFSGKVVQGYTDLASNEYGVDFVLNRERYNRTDWEVVE